MNCILSVAVLFSLFSYSESAGYLRLHLTADTDSLLHLEHSLYYSETIRLLAYETRSLDVYILFPQSRLSLSIQPLHPSTGEPLSDLSIQEFKTENNDRWEYRVVDSDTIILSVQSTFHCETGYFGPHCEHKSRNIDSTTSTSTASTSYSQVTSFDFEISDDTIIYCSLAFLVLLLVVANLVLCCYRPEPKHVYQNTLPVPIISEPKVFCIDEHSGYLSNLDISVAASRYYDAPSRFISTATLQSMV